MRILYLLFILIVINSFATTVHFALINDCHSVMEPWGPRNPITLEATIGGYPRLSYILDSLRMEFPEIIILHAGDILSGDFLSSMTCGYAIYDLWLAEGVRCFAIGNHEFDYGPRVLDSVLGEIDVPLVCANLDARGFPNLETSMRPYRIISISSDTSDDSIKIAIVSTTCEESDIGGLTAPLDFSDPITALDTMTIPPDADCAIALTHLLVSDDRSIARISWIDAVLGGHDHSECLEFVHHGGDSTPIVKAGALISSVGHLTMEYEPGTGLVFRSWETIPITALVPENPPARARLDAYRSMIASNPRIGLDPYSTTVFVAESNIVWYPVCPTGSGWEDTPGGNLITDSYRSALGTDIAVDVRGSMRMLIFRGPVTYADLYRMMPMGRDPASGLNARLIRMNVSGSSLKLMLEYSLYGSTLAPEAFPVFSGMRLGYNPSGAIMNKISTAGWTIGGNPWSPSSIYSLASTTFLVQAMDLIGFPYGAIDTMEMTAYEALVRYCTSDTFIPRYSSDGRFRDITVSIHESDAVPRDIRIEAYPNPFNSHCVIRAPKNSCVSIYDLNGRFVERASNISSKNSEGSYLWEPRSNTSTGLYLIRVENNGEILTKPIIYLK